MSGIKHIFNGLTMLVACLDKDGAIGMYRLDIHRRKGSLCIVRQEELNWEEIKNGQLKEPVLLVILGWGILRKSFTPDEESELERVTGNGQFIWEKRVTREGNRVLAFTRKERVGKLLQKLQQSKVPVVEIHIGRIAVEDNFSPLQEVSTEELALCLAGKFYDRNLGWKEMTEDSERGKALSSAIWTKIKLPLLSMLLLLLLVNYFWNDSVRREYADRQEQLILLETKSTHQDKLSRELEQVVRDFKGKGKNNWAIVLDRIASVVPEEMTLETWTVNPLLKSVEEKKALVIREGYIEMTGFTALPEKVTLFTGKVAELGFVREVKLSTIGKNRENGLFYFKLWIGL